MRKTYIFAIFFAVSSSVAMACMSIPKNITLEGASFDSISIGLDTNCSVRLSWKDPNNQNIFFRVEKDRESDKICVEKITAGDTYQKEKVCGLQLSKKMDMRRDELLNIRGKNGNVIGRIILDNQKFEILSVTAQGDVDSTLPSLSVNASGSGGSVWSITALQNSKPLGEMTADGSVCTRSVGGEGQGSLPLNGYSYTQNGGGCAGGFDQKPYKAASVPEGRFFFDGNPVGQSAGH